MLAVNPGKTPISLLQEYGTRIGKTPVYDLLKAEGQAHQPNFTFRVAVGEINCTGQGPSKKAAKHKAAEAALKMLKGGLGGPAGFCVGVDGFVEVDVSTDGERYRFLDILFPVFSLHSLQMMVDCVVFMSSSFMCLSQLPVRDEDRQFSADWM